MKLDNIRIVMVETSHSGNIGAAARAMANMGISDLTLVTPQCQVDDTAYRRSTGAHEILDKHQEFSSIAEAIADCQLVVGTSARSRSLAWPTLHPDALAEKALAMDDSSRIAILFGTERTGLTNEQLHHCHYAVTIPTNPEFSSLNVASAVQVICYELFKTLSGAEPPEELSSEKRASGAETEGFFDHLEQVMISTEFLDPAQPKHLMTRLRRLFLRAEPNQNEINILRGILTAVQNFRGG